MIALECLAERRERDGRVREHVEALVCLTQDADLTECERAPLIGALDALRTESTLRACRRPADEMDGRDYDGMSAMSFVRHCYDRGNARSRTEGSADLAGSEHVGRNLTRFVGDLQAAPALVDEA